MLLYNALTSVVLEAARLDRPRDPPPRVAEPKGFRLSHNPVPPVSWAEATPSTPVSAPRVAPAFPARRFGRLLVEE